MKKFNLTEAKNGKSVVTRIGNKVVINYVGSTFIQGVIKSRAGFHYDKQVRWKLDGTRFSPKHEHFEDLFMA